MTRVWTTTPVADLPPHVVINLSELTLSSWSDQPGYLLRAFQRSRCGICDGRLVTRSQVHTLPDSQQSGIGVHHQTNDPELRLVE
jgi:hypothetical protein